MTPWHIVKTCGCGRSYPRAGWEVLERLGVCGCFLERLELRNCLCGSTIAIDVTSRPGRLLRALARLVGLWD